MDITKYKEACILYSRILRSPNITPEDLRDATVAFTHAYAMCLDAGMDQKMLKETLRTIATAIDSEYEEIN